MYTRFVEYLNNITPQSVDGIHTESIKITNLRSAVLGKKWATSSLKNISTGQYNFDQLVMVLNESIQHKLEIKKASACS